MNIQAHAKINLCLDITGRRNDGYHELSMIMQGLALHDEIIIEKLPEKEIRLSVSADGADIPTDKTNLVYRAAELLLEKGGIEGGVSIGLVKRIPAAAGLAGGSADAAAVMKAINELYELHMTEEELMQEGVKLGADIPYCIMGGTALSEGIGEVLTRIETTVHDYVLLVKPKTGSSTPVVYKAYDRAVGNGEEIDHPKSHQMMAALQQGNREEAFSHIGNVLEAAVIPEIPLVQRIKEDMLEAGADYSCMSGSGSTVFGLFRESGAMQSAAAFFRSREYFDELSDIIETAFM